MIGKLARTVRLIGLADMKLLLGCFLLCLLTALPAAAQGADLTCQTIDIAGYANASFCLPTGVSVVKEDLAEVNYTEGREVKAVLSFDTSEIYLHLLYPCIISAGMPESEIKPHIEAYDPQIKDAGYGAQPITVEGRPAVWGNVGNWTFVAYQPADNAIMLMYLDDSLSEEVGSRFLESLEVSVNQAVTPLPPGYCARVNPGPTAEAYPAYRNISSYSKNDIDYDLVNNNYQKPVAEARMERFEATKEQMMSEMEDTKEKLDETKERLGGYGMIPNPFFQT
jgi:hypothetical protein